MNKLTADFGRWAADAGQRALKAAVDTFTGITLGGSLFGINGALNVGLVQRAGIAALGSAVSVVLSLAAKWSGDPGTASFSRPGTS